MSKENAKVLAPLKSLLKLGHFNEAKISYPVGFERGKWGSIAAGLSTSSSSMFSYTYFVQADSAREE